MSQEGLKRCIINLSKSRTERDKFRADPEGHMAGEELTDEEKDAMREALRAGNDLTAAHDKLARLQGGAPLGGDSDDAVVGEFLDRPKPKKPAKPRRRPKKPPKPRRRPKKPARKPAKKKK